MKGVRSPYTEGEGNPVPDVDGGADADEACTSVPDLSAFCCASRSETAPQERTRGRTDARRPEPRGQAPVCAGAVQGPLPQASSFRWWRYSVVGISSMPRI